MKAYSTDLRERLLEDSERGMSSKSLSIKYRVSRAWVDRLKQRFRETGDYSARKPTETRPRVLEAHTDSLLALVRSRPDATLNELRDSLNVGASRMAVWRMLQRLGITLKKKSSTHRSKTAKTSPRRVRAGNKSSRRSFSKG